MNNDILKGGMQPNFVTRQWWEVKIYVNKLDLIFSILVLVLATNSNRDMDQKNKFIFGPQ